MKFKLRTPEKSSALSQSSPLSLPASLTLPQRLMVLRGQDPFDAPAMKDLLPPWSMKDIEKAAEALVEAIEAGKRICIVGDYDADGATATAIGVRGLRLFGAEVDFVVPNRFTDGYGLSPGVVERALEKAPGLLVTVDNGISAFEGIRYANEKGVPVIVTDHHLAGETLPAALAIVNPNRTDCEFPSKNLAGCGVMWYVLAAVRRCFAQRGDARGRAKIDSVMDLLALGTVADVVKLDRNNRILVDAGLKRIREGQACAGLRALFTVTGKKIHEAGAMDMGFYIGPRINAAGRMDDASVGIQCLITDDPGEAMRLAQSLHETNALRREVQAEIQDEAEKILEKLDLQRGFSIVVADPYWHEGVIGIVAGRIKELHRRPTIVFSRSEEGVFKGSGRSIPALHLRDALAEVDRRLPGTILKFGGHAMAAGLSIREDDFSSFQQTFEDVVKHMIDAADLEEVIEHDGALTAADLTVDNARWIKMGVWGQGFPSPSFMMPARVIEARILKDKHTKFALDIDGVKVDGILFNEVVEDQGDVMVHGTLDINEWKGRETIQLMVNKVEARAENIT